MRHRPLSSPARWFGQDELPAVQQMGDDACALHLRVRVPDGVMKGLDVDARGLHGSASVRHMPTTDARRLSRYIWLLDTAEPLSAASAAAPVRRAGSVWSAPN